MINWKDRKTLKGARETMQAAAKWLRINRDLLSAAQVLALTTKIGELKQAVAERNAKEAVSHAAVLEQKVQGALPPISHPAIRENVEVLLVAVIVAMAVRTFFIQPFKIPTGSMQPTLYGVFPPPMQEPPLPEPATATIFDRLAGVLFQGKMYEPGGYRTRGDHIFVDKISYHFRKPRRGEVVVFDTSNIAEIGGASRGKFYIKRLIGLPNDAIQIQPPYVLVNSKVLDSRPAFERIYSMRDDYHGYVIPQTIPPAPYFRSVYSTYTVPPKHLFVLGDNSRSSLDGRFWGSFREQDLVGRAVMVYWPFTKRFGLID